MCKRFSDKTAERPGEEQAKMERYTVEQVKNLRSSMTDEAFVDHLWNRMILRPVERSVHPTKCRIDPKGHRIKHTVNAECIGENPIMDIVIEGAASAKYYGVKMPVSLRETPESEDWLTVRTAVKRKVKARSKRGATEIFMKLRSAEDQAVKQANSVQVDKGEDKSQWLTWKQRS